MHITHHRLSGRMARAGVTTVGLAAGLLTLAGIFAERHRVPGQP